MAATQRGQSRNELVFVLINQVFAYGWKTKDLAAITGISEADLASQLGHMSPTQASAVANVIMVTGANSPKPARVTKKLANATTTQQGSIGTFIAYNKMAAANAANWSVGSRARGVSLKANVAGQRTVTAVAELSNGLLYAYPLNKADFDLVSADLGLQSAAQVSSTEFLKLATGCRSKPGRAAIEDGGGVLSTFFSTASRDAALTAGFSILEDEYAEYTPAAPATP